MIGNTLVKRQPNIPRLLPLDIPLCALLAWKACFIRFSFYTQDRTGLWGWENIVFIVLCMGYSLGVLAYGLIGSRLKSEKENRISFYIAMAAAILCTVFSANTRMSASMLFTFLAAFFVAFATGRCLHKLAVSLHRSKYGLLFGISRAIAELITLLLCVQSFLRLPVNGLTVALCLLLAVAGLTYHPTVQAAEPEKDADPPPKRKTLLKLAVILFVFCGVAGMLDNLYAFDGIFRNTPHFILYIYLYSIGINLLVGFLFNRTNWRMAVLASIALICAGQSLSFFSSIEALAFPYIALTTLGMVAMEVYTVALPVYYARDTKHPGLVCCLGLFAQYLGYGSTSVLFEFFSKDLYLSVLGVVLMTAIGLLTLLFVTSNEYETDRAVARVRQMTKVSGFKAESLEEYDLTPREKEICVMTLQGKAERQIAVSLGIAVPTVRFHRSGIYRKMNINSQQELFAKLFGEIQ